MERTVKSVVLAIIIIAMAIYIVVKFQRRDPHNVGVISPNPAIRVEERKNDSLKINQGKLIKSAEILQTAADKIQSSAKIIEDTYNQEKTKTNEIKTRSTNATLEQQDAFLSKYKAD